MNYIFLDVDGVLNTVKTKNRISGYCGVESVKCQILKQIVDALDAKIVLCSSWKRGWTKDHAKCDVFAKYLNRRLAQFGMTIEGKTDDCGIDRGHGILRYVQKHPCDGFIVLDDEIFPDYEECDIKPHLVRTYFYGLNGGLQEYHVTEAKEKIGASIDLGGLRNGR